MPEKPDLFKEELDQLSDQEIEARLAAAVWVDDKRASVLRYLEEKKLGKKNQARSAELEIAIAPTKRLGRLRGWRRRRTGEQTSPSQSRAWQRQQPYQQQSSPWSACILSGEILPCWRARRCLTDLMSASGLLSDVTAKVLNSSEDAHTKNMSTFEANEHFRR